MSHDLSDLTMVDTKRPIIFLAGAHGAEKSTMANAIRDRFGLPYHKSVTSRVYESAGRKPKDQISLREHLDIQKQIYVEWINMYNDVAAQGGVFDRSPFDIIAYTLALVPQSVTIADDQLASDLVWAMIGVLGRSLQDTPVLWCECIGYDNHVSFDRGSDKAISGGAHALKIEVIISAMFARAQIKTRKLLADRDIEYRLNVVDTGLSAVTKPLFSMLS